MTPAAIAANRFGIGMRGDATPAADPMAALRQELSRFQPRPAALASVPDRKAAAEALEQLRMAKRESKQPASSATAAPAGTARSDTALNDTARSAARHEVRDLYIDSVGARVNAALQTTTPWLERLVHFWSNHFAVSVDKQPVLAYAGLLEFEAIRPQLLGRFADLLIAVEHHPAMLLYLDQAQSIGPDSVVGQRRGGFGAKQHGLNENLAREILELHTLGVRSGYSQNDVTELARALTGWTVAGLGGGRARRFFGAEAAPGDAFFRDQQHQPGTRQILGKHYGSSGARQSHAVLADLARHPATAQHIAGKLARHFAGDSPSSELVTRLSRTFLETDGDLPQLYRTLLEAPECWNSAALKFKSPWEWSLSALRSINLDSVEARAAAGMLLELGQAVWKPGSPAGYDDLAASWAAPDALVRRVEAGQRIAQRAPRGLDARALAAQVLPGGVSDNTAKVLAQAESGTQALALLWASPEFLRR